MVFSPIRVPYAADKATVLSIKIACVPLDLEVKIVSIHFVTDFSRTTPKLARSTARAFRPISAIAPKGLFILNVKHLYVLG
mmetsp:Transcript_2076/g.7511  ORF Transcript_2076/g.7511 Transcript_2076/m.7511 type:complete len:81 (-) Transcript_2076:365-607(-)